MSFGGVARNISENLCRLGVPVSMIASFGGDTYATLLKNHCKNVGININNSLFLPQYRSSTYVCISDEHGEMQSAVADTDICNCMDTNFLESHMCLINSAKVVVLDTNIPREAISYLLKSCRRPIFVDPVSTAKASKLKGKLAGIYAIKPNIAEAQVLSGRRIENHNDLQVAADVLLRKGIKQVFISMGASGVFYADENERGVERCIPSKVVNTTGAGDSFMAAIVYAHINSYRISTAAKLGMAAASICVASEESVSQEMCVDLMNYIKERIK